MNNFDNRRDPTRPLPPAFTKLTPQVDLMERQAARRAKGGLAPPMLYAKLDAIRGTKGKRNAGPA